MEEKVLLQATVCYPVRGREILLAHKMKKIGAGCWNGYGGGGEAGESLPDTAVRELFEESGLIASTCDLTKIAIMYFHNTKTDGTVFVAEVHFYTVALWSGEIRSTAEMSNPTWFRRTHLPLGDMMPADRVFLPIALGGKKLIGSAHYGPFQKELKGEVVIHEVSEFPLS